MATNLYKLWSALYDYKIVMCRGFFTRSSRKDLVKKLDARIEKRLDCSDLLREFTTSIHKGNTGCLGQSRLYASFADHGFFSRCVGFGPKNRNENRVLEAKEKRPLAIENLKLFRDFIIQLKSNTSAWYGGYLASFFRSQRKEHSFAVMIASLEKSLAAANYFKTDISANPSEILRIVMSTALVARGSSKKNNQTSSGLQAINLLNTDHFKPLKDLLSLRDGAVVSYENLENFVKTERSCATNNLYPTFKYYSRGESVIYPRI